MHCHYNVDPGEQAAPLYCSKNVATTIGSSAALATAMLVLITTYKPLESIAIAGGLAAPALAGIVATTTGGSAAAATAVTWHDGEQYRLQQNCKFDATQLQVGWQPQLWQQWQAVWPPPLAAVQRRPPL